MGDSFGLHDDAKGCVLMTTLIPALKKMPSRLCRRDPGISRFGIGCLRRKIWALIVSLFFKLPCIQACTQRPVESLVLSELAS